MNSGLCISVTGGGMLGIGPAWFLTRLERDLGYAICNRVVGQAGTSTGSIIAAALAEGMPAQKIFDLYNDNLRKIFTKFPWYKRAMPSCPTYDNSNLKALLKKYFTGKCSDWSKPTFIPATYMNGQHVEKVWDKFDTDAKAFAVLTSCSAPTYFNVVVDDAGRSFCDGGMWANSCSDILLAGMFKAGFKNIRILNFETGMITPNTSKGDKSLIEWAAYIFNDWVARASTSPAFECQCILGDENFFQAAPTVSKKFDMDDLSKTDEVIKIWDKYYDSVKKDILRFVKVY